MHMKRNLLVTSTLGLFIPAAVLSQQDEPVHDFQVALRATPLEKGSLFTKVSNISLPNGNWKGVANGISIWTGYLKNGRLHNDWQSWYVNGKPLDAGKLVNGYPTGEWKYWDSSGQLRAIRHYSHDKLQRVKEEIRLGHPRNFYYPITAFYRKTRSALHFLTASFSFPLSNQDPEPDLPVRIRKNADARGYHPPFPECLHHGLFINYFGSGQIKDSGYFNNGLPHGVWVHYNSEGGSFWQGEYRNGTRQREWKLFDAVGKLLKIIFYDRDGTETWRKEY